MFLFKILSGTYGGTSVESNEQLSSIVASLTHLYTEALPPSPNNSKIS
jgi:hypothetical protein